MRSVVSNVIRDAVTLYTNAQLRFEINNLLCSDVSLQRFSAKQQCAATVT